MTVNISHQPTTAETSDGPLFTEKDLISSCSRAQLLADGQLIDLTEWASARTGFIGGFTIPVACTRAVYTLIESIPQSRIRFESVRGRAHDMLWMASLASRRAQPQVSTIEFHVEMRVRRQRIQRFKMHIGPGDTVAPVITIMLPEES